MKKILYTEFSSGFGGSSSMLLDLITLIDRNKFQPVVLVLKDGPNFDKIRSLGIEVIKISQPIIGFTSYRFLGSRLSFILDCLLFFFPNVLRIERVIRENKIDLVHVNNNIKHCFDVIQAAKFAQVPCICHMREFRKTGGVERAFGPYTKMVIVTNKHAYEHMKSVLGEHKVKLIYEGINLNSAIATLSSEQMKNKLGISGHFCVGIMGRLVKEKGLVDFIKAAAIVHGQYSEIRFLVVGDDPDQTGDFKNQLQKDVKTLGLEKIIIFTGWRTDKFDMINAMDVLVQCSTQAEGFGLTCVEAMALKKPIIVTNVPGPSEIVINNTTGIIVNVNDPQMLAKAIIDLYEQPQKLSSFAQAGERRVREVFDIKMNVQALERIYSTYV